MKLALLLLILSLLVLSSLGFPLGPGACGGPNGFTALDDVTNSPHAVPLNNLNYWVLTGVPKTYTPGKQYTISLDGTGAPAITDAQGCAENAIAGFLVIAKDQNGIGQGTWEATTYTQQVNCGEKAGVYSASLNETKPANVKFNGVTGGVAAGHTLSFNSNLTPTIWAVNWTAPATGAGVLNFTGVAVIDPITSFILIPSISEGPAASTTALTPATSAIATSTEKTSTAKTSTAKTSTSKTKETTQATVASTSQVVSTIDTTDTTDTSDTTVDTTDTTATSVFTYPIYTYPSSRDAIAAAGSLAPFGFAIFFGLFLAAIRS